MKYCMNANGNGARRACSNIRCSTCRHFPHGNMDSVAEISGSGDTVIWYSPRQVGGTITIDASVMYGGVHYPTLADAIEAAHRAYREEWERQS